MARMSASVFWSSLDRSSSGKDFAPDVGTGAHKREKQPQTAAI